MEALIGGSLGIGFCILVYFLVVHPDDVAMRKQQERSDKAAKEFYEIISIIEEGKAE